MKLQHTPVTKAGEIIRTWHFIDVGGKTLGREATFIAELLMGKGKPNFVRNLDCGDYVVVTNAALVKLTGKKEEGKVYLRYSGYPSGLRKTTVKEMRAKKPEEIIRLAVSGMLPRNRLHDRMLKRLFIFPGNEHTYADKIKKQKETKSS